MILTVVFVKMAINYCQVQFKSNIRQYRPNPIGLGYYAMCGTSSWMLCSRFFKPNSYRSECSRLARLVTYCFLHW